MRLSDVHAAGCTVLRDAKFVWLGLCGAKPGQAFLTFAGDEKFLKIALANPEVSCVMIPPELAEHVLVKSGEKGICVSPKLRVDFFQLHNALAAGKCGMSYCWEPQPTRIGADCQISPLAEIAPQNVTIGRNVVIESFVSVKGNVHIGDHSIIRSGTVLGGSGLEFIRMGEEGILPVTHCGGLVIGANVEVQYNCNLSRSLFPWDDTVIGDETKIESLVHVAHGVKLGKRGLIAASACIGGSALLGDDVWVGPNATISSEVKVGQHARVSLGAVVVGNVADGQTVSGNFAVDHERFMREMLGKML